MVFPSSVQTNRSEFRRARPLLASDLGLIQERTEAETDPGEIKTIIWGTNVNIQESMDLFKDFCLNFTLEQRILMDNQDEDCMGEQKEVFEVDKGI